MLAVAVAAPGVAGNQNQDGLVNVAVGITVVTVVVAAAVAAVK